MPYTAVVSTQRGNRLTWYNAGSALANKQVVVIRSGSSGCIGITTTAIAATSSGELYTAGGDEQVVTLPKKSGDVFGFGDIAYWDSGNSRLTTTSSGNTKAGWCCDTSATGNGAASAKTTMNIKLFN